MPPFHFSVVCRCLRQKLLSGCARYRRWFGVSLLFGLVCQLVLASHAEDLVPTGPSRKTAWTSSRIHGSPEPAAPYRLVPLPVELTGEGPLDFCVTPAGDQLFVLSHRGTLEHFPLTPNAPAAGVCLQLGESLPEFAESFGFTLDPDFQDNGHVYICYVRKHGDPAGTRVSRFTLMKPLPGAAVAPKLDPASELVLITWYGGGHNGGCLKFGNDGLLYISAGDGTNPTPPDEFKTGQDLSDLLSSIMRIDVRQATAETPYRVPQDNPFVNTPGARPEIWAYGLRNVWRFSIDVATGELWAGDVGWELWELIHRIERGGNYGWALWEGPQRVRADVEPGPTAVIPALVAHPHTEARSITGGVVYRGQALPELQGAYLYGDYETGKLWGVRAAGNQITLQQELCDTTARIVSFGPDEHGELLVLDMDRRQLSRLERNPHTASATPFPVTLSETGLFTDVRQHTPAAGVYEYAINCQPWRDGATARRWVALPGNTQIDGRGDWIFPLDSVLAQTWFTAAGKPLETRILHQDGHTWQPYSYRWRADGSDADLIPKSGWPTALNQKSDRPVDQADHAASPHDQAPADWQFHSRTECMVCHNFFAGTVLGFEPAQLNVHRQGNHQLETLMEAGLFTHRVPRKAPLVAFEETSAPLEARARSYLHANCSHCHRPGGGGSAQFSLLFGTEQQELQLVDAPPMLGNFGLPGARLVQSGAPFQSVLLYRMSTLGSGRMPHLGSKELDPAGLALVEAWIGSLPATAPAAPETLSNITAAPETLSKIAALDGLTDVAFVEELGKLMQEPQPALMLASHLRAHPLPAARFQSFRQLVQARSGETTYGLFASFLPAAERVKKLGDHFELEPLLQLTGDPAAGRTLFFAPGGTGCQTCHRVGEAGGKAGPALTGIAKQRTPRQLLTSLVHPSQEIDAAYRQFLVETNDGRQLSGLVQRSANGDITLISAQGTSITLQSSEVAELIPLEQSLMPEHLLRDYTPQQAADLLAFLSSLK